MGKKTGKNTKKYGRSKEVIQRTNEIVEQQKSNILSKEIASKSDSELFVLDTSKALVKENLQGVYSAIPESSPKKSIGDRKQNLAPRNEIEDWKHKEKYEKKSTKIARQQKHDDQIEQSRYKNMFSSFTTDYWGADKEKLQKRIRTPGVFVSNKRKAASKPNANEHIPLPQGGESYNPSYQDHQKLLNVVLKGEEGQTKKEKEEKDFWRSLPHVTFEEQEAAAMEGVENFYFKQQLMGEDEINSKKEAGKTTKTGSQEDNEKTENIEEFSFSTISNRKLRMTPREREQHKRKAAFMQFVKRVADREKLRIARQNQIRNAETIVRNLSEDERIREERLRLRNERRNDPKRVQKIGKFSVESARSAYKLTEELKGSLRRLQPNGTVLVADRLASYMKRNILEPMPLRKGSRLSARERARLRWRQKRNKKIVICTRNRPEQDKLYKSQPKILKHLDLSVA